MLIAIVVFLLDSVDFVKAIEAKTLDYRFRHFPISQEADTSIVLVAIDNSSLDYFQAHGISWPWPRTFYAHITDYFTASNAKSVLYDLLFYEPDLNREETYAQETDSVFAIAIQSNGRVVLEQNTAGQTST